MRKFIVNLPIEVWVIYLPTILFYISVLFLRFSCGNECLAGIFHGYFSDILLKNNIIFFFFFPILFYFLILLFFFRKLKRSEFWKFLKSFVFVFLGIYFLMTFILFLTQMLFATADRAVVAQNSIVFAWADFGLLGDFTWSFFERVIPKALETFIFNSYFLITPFTFATLFALLFKNKLIFRKFLLAYLLAFIIGLPFWFGWPVLGPNMMFKQNQLKVNLPAEIKTSIQNTNFSEQKLKVLNHYANYYAFDGDKSVDITSFPSMHSAWGVIITLALLEALGAFTLVATLPWLIAMLLGTVLTLQHYFLDTIFGVLVGLLTWLLVSKFLKLEGKYFQDKYALFYSLEILEQSTKSFLEKLKNKIEKLLF